MKYFTAQKTPEYDPAFYRIGTDCFHIQAYEDHIQENTGSSYSDFIRVVFRSYMRFSAQKQSTSYVCAAYQSYVKFAVKGFDRMMQVTTMFCIPPVWKAYLWAGKPYYRHHVVMMVMIEDIRILLQTSFRKNVSRLSSYLGRCRVLVDAGRFSILHSPCISSPNRCCQDIQNINIGDKIWKNFITIVMIFNF